MFRSGTTLVGRMLHAHPRIALASDGTFPFYKFLRDALESGVGNAAGWGGDAPLADYYFNAHTRRTFEAIQSAILDLPIAAPELDRLRTAVARWCVGHPQYAPKLAPLQDKIHGATFKQVLKSLYNIAAEAYGDAKTEAVGTKEVWTGEFCPCLHRSMPGMKLIYVVRDPRGVFASKKHRNAQYPWLFLGRQWRKLAALAWLYGPGGAMPGESFMLLRFEDLLADPEGQARKTCDFLGIKFDEKMVDPTGYVDGYGDPWGQNTAYEKGKGNKAFNPATADRWREGLSPEEITLTDHICGPEMALLGYETATLRQDPQEMLTAVPMQDPEQIAAWIQRHFPVEPSYQVLAMAHENMRLGLLERGADINDDKLVNLCFLDRRIYQKMLELGVK